MSIKRYTVGIIHNTGDAPKVLPESPDGEYFLVSDVAGLVKGLREQRKNTKCELGSGRLAAMYGDAGAVDAMTVLLDLLRGVATPMRSNEGTDG
jgi:hypothetical protein